MTDRMPLSVWEGVGKLVSGTWGSAENAPPLAHDTGPAPGAFGRPPRMLTGPQRERRARQVVAELAVAVPALHVRIVGAAELFEGDGPVTLEELRGSLGGDAVRELTGWIVDAAEGAWGELAGGLANVAAALDRARASVGRAAPRTRSEVSLWSAERARREVAEAVVAVGAAWRALADAGVVAGVVVPVAPEDHVEEWCRRALDLRDSLAEAARALSRAIGSGPAPATPSARRRAVEAVAEAEAELMRLANLAGQLATDADG